MSTRVLNIIMYLLMALGAVFFILTVYHGDDAFSNTENPLGAEKLQNSILAPFLLIGLYAVYATALLTVGFMIYGLLKNASEAKGILIGIGGIVVIFFISYLTASGADYINYDEDMGITEGSSKFVEAGLTVLYITMAATIIAILYAEIKRSLSR